MPLKGVGKSLSHAPLSYVLCQVRFSPVLAIAGYIPKLQEQIRKSYPLFKHSAIQTLKFSSGGAVESSESPRWEFINKLETSGFLVQKDSVVFHTTAYKRFDDFVDELIGGLKIIQEVLDVPIVERIGIRYIDHIVPEGDEPLSKYINEGLRGMPFNDLGLETQYQNLEASTKTPKGNLMIRFTQSIHSTPLPPDLQPLELMLNDALKPLDRVTGVLDTDHYVNKNLDFDVRQVSIIIKGLHEYVSGIFSSATSDYARKIWT